MSTFPFNMLRLDLASTLITLDLTDVMLNCNVGEAIWWHILN